MGIIKLKAEADNIKRFYLEDEAYFEKDCPKCERDCIAEMGMIEYPYEGFNIEFICEDCDYSFEEEVKCLGGETFFHFELPNGVTGRQI